MGREIATGYKQTEVGIIPVDWNVKKIKSVCTLINGRGFKPFEWKKSGLPIIRIQNLNGSDDFNFYQGIYDKKIEVDNGQLLFAWSGSRGTSFGSHLWTGVKGLLNYHTWKIQINESEIDSGFFFYALKQLTAFIEDKAHGASALVHTQKWEMEGFEFPAPPTKSEQTAIANALSDVDALISGLDNTLAKKRLIKQGAMQELLTGKKRLAGFSGEWKFKKLSDICAPSKNRINPLTSNKNYKCIELEHLSQESGRLIGYEDSRNLKSQKTIFKKNDVLFGKLRPYLRKYFFADFDGVCTTEIWVLISNNKVESNFLYYLIQTDKIIEAANQSTGTKMPRAEWKVMKEITITLPEAKVEQAAIAQTLSDMDSEIEALEKRHTKTLAIKQGMMQELLTGKTRLV